MGELKKYALLISLHEDITEINELAESLDYKIVMTFIQKRNHPDVNSYIGLGKIEEIKEYINSSDKEISTIIVDGELKPSQWFNLEKKLNKTVYDRIRLILAIFEERADRREAHLQVRLASLEYEKPYVRELIHRARSGEHPGLMSGGEYQVDDYYEMIKKQMKKIRVDLEKIRQERDLRRKHRHKGGFYLVSLVGYTNAGKSSLLNKLADEHVTVEGRLFSTLSTTTRRIKDNQLPILLSDTVGFIENLPTWIIDAFHSTLEEIQVADVVLLVVDISEDNEAIAKKLRLSLDILVELGVGSPILLVLNKIDKCTEDKINSALSFLEENRIVNLKDRVLVSANNNINIDILIDSIYNHLPHLSHLKIRLPSDDKSQSFISWLYEKSDVVNITYNNSIIITLQCNNLIKESIISKCINLNGEIIEN